ncbi:flagellar basal body P-ring formation chaperone FlgA [Pseudosulfitobacter sp. DSM 107133]|jgi:flagella basal body P-ring formation protein FlgA|uniref:flagellar basal body P-ring formation chaperone FlgA n=1 Tax=Pseudosulfitobacter sp. DSM 107133 TaxID=2883100 RepID=UPI000DF18BB1|nr:flagellar basal body P-ring formation chaperone FlgA [Pseudosulfitobacter sp. DSM 107133]UOA28819.1 hypothetical protein DSM107133_03577 [Pseudosulfitobacter sp. DSM 107133]
MIRILMLASLIFSAAAASADIVVATRTIRPQSLIDAADVQAVAGTRADAFENPLDVVGQEARVALYAGRPIRFDDIGPPALVDRNQIVQLQYHGAQLVIHTEGRALERGGIGDRVRIMNLNSRATLFGLVQADGTVRVSN